MKILTWKASTLVEILLHVRHSTLLSSFPSKVSLMMLFVFICFLVECLVGEFCDDLCCCGNGSSTVLFLLFLLVNLFLSLSDCETLEYLLLVPRSPSSLSELCSLTPESQVSYSASDWLEPVPSISSSSSECSPKSFNRKRFSLSSSMCSFSSSCSWSMKHRRNSWVSC